jgi:hypothetical protein
MSARQQNSTSYPITFLLVTSIDHITGATGKTPTVTLSKNGGAFGAAAGLVSEIANGIYALAGNATDRNTLGELRLHVTATGCDPVDMAVDITTGDPFASASVDLTPVTTVLDKFHFTGGVGEEKVNSALDSTERASIAAAVWNALTSGLTTVGSIGRLLVAKVGLIGTTGATVPVEDDEPDTLTFYVGKVYSVTRGTAKRITSDSTVDYTGGTAKLQFGGHELNVTVSGTVGAWAFDIEMSAAEGTVIGTGTWSKGLLVPTVSSDPLPPAAVVTVVMKEY